MSVKEQLIENAKQGKVLAHKCTDCGHLHLSTVYFCEKCGSKGFEDAILTGTGSIATYTIITVASCRALKNTRHMHLWCLKLDDVDLRISGFMAGIATPADLPVGTKAKITGFDERGIIVEKQ